MYTGRMKKIAAAFLLSALFIPAFASADAYGIQPTLGQLLTRIAALKSILSHDVISCEVAATKSTVKAGEAFTIAWGSFGADSKYSTDPQNVYPENGEQQVVLDTPQMRKYSFSFYGPNGTKKTCEQIITVLPH